MNAGNTFQNSDAYHVYSMDWMSWTLALVHETTFEAWMKQTVENFTLGCTPPCCPIVHDQGELLAVYLYSTFQATRLSCAEMQEDHRPCRLRIPMSIPKLYRLLCNLLWCWAYYHEYSASLIPVMAQAGAPHHKLDLFLDRFFFFFENVNVSELSWLWVHNRKWYHWLMITPWSSQIGAFCRKVQNWL